MNYCYVGPPELRVLDSPTRCHVESAGDVLAWAGSTPQTRDDEITATFIVNPKGELWIADRRSEHVACAAGGPVTSAGEITFRLEKGEVEVVEVTNQSTGFCPEPRSWSAVARALGRIGLAHPGAFTSSYDFRRCENCGAINVVKEAWFWCALCEAELPRAWNLGAI